MRSLRRSSRLTDAPRSALAAILRLRCPRCRQGRVYAGHFAMHETCGECGYKFQREPGYFLGAMYVSYALAAFFISLCTVLAWLVTALELQWCALIGIGLFLPLVPAVFRYSRVIWMNIDRWIDPV